MVHHPYEAPYNTLEKVIIKDSALEALKRYALSLVNEGEWPSHLSSKTPTEKATDDQIRDALSDYLKWSKGSGGVADLLDQCSKNEMPQFIVETLFSIKQSVEEELKVKGTGEEKQSIVKDRQEESSAKQPE